MKLQIGQHQDQPQPFAIDDLEFLLWCNQVASRIWLRHTEK